MSQRCVLVDRSSYRISHANLMYLYCGLKQWSVCLFAYCCFIFAFEDSSCSYVLISSFCLYGFRLVCRKCSVNKQQSSASAAILLCGLSAVFVVKYLGIAISWNAIQSDRRWGFIVYCYIHILYKFIWIRYCVECLDIGRTFQFNCLYYGPPYVALAKHTIANVDWAENVA